MCVCVCACVCVCVYSTESDINIFKEKELTVIDSLSTIWKSNLFRKIRRRFFQVGPVSVLFYDITTLALTKRLEKK